MMKENLHHLQSVVEEKMLSNLLSTIIFLEVIFTLFIAWGLMHEERFVAFEDRIIAKVKKRIAKKKSKRNFFAPDCV